MSTCWLYIRSDAMTDWFSHRCLLSRCYWCLCIQCFTHYSDSDGYAVVILKSLGFWGEGEGNNPKAFESIGNILLRMIRYFLGSSGKAPFYVVIKKPERTLSTKPFPKMNTPNSELHASTWRKSIRKRREGVSEKRVRKKRGRNISGEGKRSEIR